MEIKLAADYFFVYLNLPSPAALGQEGLLLGGLLPTRAVGVLALPLAVLSSGLTALFSPPQPFRQSRSSPACFQPGSCQPDQVLRGQNHPLAGDGHGAL